ncbi:MAG: hypothetical protein ABIF77_07020 [bacterium]
MKERAGIFTLILFVLAVVFAGILTLHFTSFSARSPQAALLPMEIPPATIPEPWLPRITNPTAILALDVSGSLGIVKQPSDPDHLQALAVLQFYETYLQLAEMVMGPGETARIAVVLYGTVAQTITRDDNETRFLPVTAENRTLFRDLIEHYLGTPGVAVSDSTPDPRHSQDTDHALALEVIASLVEDLPSPPAVLFMTDGRPDPHPCYSPLVSETMRRQLAGCRRAGEVPGTLDVTSRPPIFNRRDGASPVNKVHMPEGIDVDQGITARVSDLLRLRFPVPGHGQADVDRHATPPTAPLAWFPLFLDMFPRWRPDINVRAILGSDTTGRDYWGLEPGLLHCQRPGAMPRHFVASLARWFHMTELQLAPGERKLRVPPHTGALVIHVECDPPVAGVNLIQNGRTVPLTGQDRFWSGVVAEDCDGEWSFDMGRTGPGGIQLTTTVFRSPRYDWAVSAPDSCGWDPRSVPPQAHLYLCRLDDGSAVDGGEIYPNLPATLAASLVVGGEAALPVEFRRLSGDEDAGIDEDDGDDGPNASRMPTYIADLPVDVAGEGLARLTVFLEPMRDANVPISNETLTCSLVFVSSTRLVAFDHKHRRTDGIQLEEVPKAPDWTWSLRD